MNGDLEGRRSHWKNYYSSEAGARLTPPSQFAAFVAQEIDRDTGIIEIGCGNGRDAIFFSIIGFDVFAIDQSGAGVDIARQQASAMRANSVRFVQDDVSTFRIAESIPDHSEKALCVYARFFLHAITEAEQRSLFAMLARDLKAGDKLAFEYRTLEDAAQLKMASPHFRRYQDAADVDNDLYSLGFERLYGVKGVGFAKYFDEDAHVARAIYSKVGA